MPSSIFSIEISPCKLICVLLRQELVKLRVFLSNWIFSKAFEARSTSSECSSSLYLQPWSSFLKAGREPFSLDVPAKGMDELALRLPPRSNKSDEFASVMRSGGFPRPEFRNEPAEDWLIGASLPSGGRPPASDADGLRKCLSTLDKESSGPDVEALSAAVLLVFPLDGFPEEFSSFK
eukprot:Gb_04797 [translate_table: standard]